MCLDPLGVAQLQISEAIELLADEAKQHATRDPGVAEAVRARLEVASAKLREVQAGFSRETAKHVTRDIMIEVGFLIVELMLRSSATHCNFSRTQRPIFPYATRFNHSTFPVSGRSVTGRTREARRRVGIVHVTPRARHTRAHPGSPSPHRGATAGSFRHPTGRRARRCSAPRTWLAGRAQQSRRSGPRPAPRVWRRGSAGEPLSGRGGGGGCKALRSWGNSWKDASPHFEN